MGYLDGYRVLDLTDFRGMMAGRIMADLGAEVVMVEPEGGAAARRRLCADEGDGPSLLWTTFAHNKLSLTADIATPAGRDLIERLAKTADFVLISGSQEEIGALDLSYDRLSEGNSRLIMVVLSPFGLSGPKAGYADSDLIIWAASGTLARNRVGERVPIRIGTSLHGYFHGAVEAVVGALLALAERAVSGQGQLVDLSCQESMTFSNQLQGLYPLLGDQASPPDQAVSLFRQLWQSKDGYLQFTLTSGPATGHFSNGFMQWLAEEGMLPEDFPPVDWSKMPQTSGSGLSASGVTAEKYAEMGFAEAERKRLEDIMERFFLERDTETLLRAARDRRLLLAPILSVDQIARNEHLKARGIWLESEEPDGSTQRLVGPFARTLPHAFVNRGACGAPGSDTGEILGRWLHLSPDEIAVLQARESI